MARGDGEGGGCRTEESCRDIMKRQHASHLPLRVELPHVHVDGVKPLIAPLGRRLLRALRVDG